MISRPEAPRAIAVSMFGASNRRPGRLIKLTEKQKEQFEAYMTAQREVNVLTDCETFIYAFRLGAKIMMDVLTEGKMKEI